jgi:hypothetical protein
MRPLNKSQFSGKAIRSATSSDSSNPSLQLFIALAGSPSHCSCSHSLGDTYVTAALGTYFYYITVLTASFA